MMEPRLQHQLGDLESLLRRTRVQRKLAVTWLVMAALAVVLFLLGWNSRLAWLLPLAAGIVAGFILLVREDRRPVDFRAVVAAVERDYPELRPLLSTAAEQQLDADSGGFRFLQLRVIDQVLNHQQRGLWRQNLKRKLSFARKLHLGTLIIFVAVLFIHRVPAKWQPAARSWFSREVVVTPGDTEVERGTALLISARFGGTPPAQATLVLVPASGKTKGIPLERHFSDPIFGASLFEVTENGLYHVEYGGRKTRDYKITVFDYPALVRADADLRFPGYTSLTNRIIRDTRRLSAVEGTQLTYTLQLNKPVVRARFVGKEQALTLAVHSNAVATLDDLTLTNSGRYALELVDADGRTNKAPADFSIQVLPNKAPELKLAFPRGDPRVSPLEELQLQASAADDFGVLKYGVGFGVAGQDPRLVELGQSAPANEKRSFDHLISLEQLGVEVDQVVAYFAWAEDYGPDGKVRRTFSDMFFAEVRPFEEIFRADQSGAAESAQGRQQQQGNENARLAELQKQIVIATWKLQRNKQGAAGAVQP